MNEARVVRLVDRASRSRAIALVASLVVLGLAATVAHADADPPPASRGDPAAGRDAGGRRDPVRDAGMHRDAARDAHAASVDASLSAVLAQGSLADVALDAGRPSPMGPLERARGNDIHGAVLLGGPAGPDPRRPRGRATLGAVAVVPPRDATGAAVRGVLARNTGAFRACYEQQLAARPSLAGALSLRFVLDADGSVHGEPTSSGLDAAPELGACVRARLRSWVFPVATGRATVGTVVTFAPATGSR